MTKQDQDTSTSAEADVTDEQIFAELAKAEANGEVFSRDDAGDEEVSDNSFEDVEDRTDDDAEQAASDDEDSGSDKSGNAGSRTDANDNDDDATPAGAAENDEDDAPDIWAGATPAARKAYEELEKRRNREKGTVSGLQRKINDLERQLRETAAKQATENAGDEEDVSDDDLQRVAEEYPEVAAPLIKQIKSLQKKLDGTVEQVTTTQTDMATQRYMAEQSKFLETHEDGFDVISDNLSDFQAWVDDQPRELRDAWEANKEEMTDGAGAIKLVTAFKGFLNGENAQTSSASGDGGKPKSELSSRRRRQMDGARSVRGGSNAPGTTDPGGTSEEERIWNEFAHLEKQRSGAQQR